MFSWHAVSSTLIAIKVFSHYSTTSNSLLGLPAARNCGCIASPENIISRLSLFPRLLCVWEMDWGWKRVAFFIFFIFSFLLCNIFLFSVAKETLRGGDCPGPAGSCVSLCELQQSSHGSHVGACVLANV